MDAERRARLGARWVCGGCGTAFYDLGKVVAICPSCGSEPVKPAARPASKPQRSKNSAKGRSKSGLRAAAPAPENDAEVEPPDDGNEATSDHMELDS